MADFGRLFLEYKDMDGRQHSAMGLLTHSLHTPMGLEKLWVTNCCIHIASATRFAANAQGLRLSQSENSQHRQGASGE